jgi:hypothetical protein
MEPYSDVSVLFWFAYVDANGDITYKLTFKHETQDASPVEFAYCITNAGTLCYPIVCLN